MDRMADLYGRFVGGDRACFEEIVAGYYDGKLLKSLLSAHASLSFFP